MILDNFLLHQQLLLKSIRPHYLQQYHSNGRTPFSSQERNLNSFGFRETDRIFGTTQHKSRPFIVPAEEQGKDYDYEVRYSGSKEKQSSNSRFLPNRTDAPPVVTFRNTNAYLRSQVRSKRKICNK